MDFSRGWRSSARGAATPSAPPHGGIRAALSGPSYRGHGEKIGLHPQLSRRKCSAPRLAQPSRTPGTRFGDNQGPESLPARTKPLSQGAQPPIPPPANLKASIWAPAYSYGPGAGSLPWPPASDKSPNRCGCCSRNPPGWLLPPPPAPHAPALPCSPARARAVSARRTRPSQRGSSAGAAPRGVPGSGLWTGSAGSGAGCPPLAAPAPAPAAPRDRGRGEGAGEKLPATPTPGAGALAAAARPPAAECERLRCEPARPPLSMPSAAVGETQLLGRGREPGLGSGPQAPERR